MRSRWRAVLAAAVASPVALGLSLMAAPAAHAGSGTPLAGPFPVGNSVDYQTSDFESGATNWIAVTNVSSVTNITSASLHGSHALAFTATAAGTAQINLQEGTGNSSIPATAGDTYTVGAWFKLPSTTDTGETMTFKVGADQADGTFIANEQTPALTLAASTSWQYVEGQVTMPALTAQIVASPKVILGNAKAGQVTDMDMVAFKPYRAAQAIGQHGSVCNGCSYTPAEWGTTENTTLGGVGQTDKEFNASLPSAFSGTNCSGDEAIQGSTNYAAWPLCIIAYKDPATQTAVSTFLSGVPSQQQVILVWHQEPEGDSFSSEPGCGTDTGATAFVCEDQLQGGYVHNSASYGPNIAFADDSGGGQYAPSKFTGCQWIPAPSATGDGVDIYLEDHYNNGTVNGGNLETDNNAPAWTNWLGCASPKDRPVGLGEMGLDNSPIGPSSLCGQSTSNASNLPGGLLADQTYLEQLPMSGNSLLHGNNEPVAAWDYWYSNYGGTPVCTLFDNTHNAITDWENIITANGGGA